jgi:hypothetical protein
MNTYSVNDSNGVSIGTIQAADADTALSNAIFLYGPDVSVVRQYSTNALSIDPIWILLALLLAAQMTRKKSH